MSKSILIEFFKKHKLSYAIGFTFMFLTSYIQTLFPRVLGNTIDILKANNFSFHSVEKNIAYILLISAATFTTTFIWRNCIIANSRDLECYLRERLYDHFQKLSPEFYNRRKTGDLLAYAINDLSAVRMTFGFATALSLNGIVICILSIYSMCNAINWYLTLMTLLPIPAIIYFMFKIGGIVQKRFRIVQESFGSISDRVQENIYGIRVIKAYVQEEYELNNFESLNNKMKAANLDMVRISSYLSPIIEIAFSISFVLNLIVGGKLVLKGSVSLGDFIAFNGYLTMIMAPVLSVGRIVNITQRGMASLKRLNAIFDTEPDITDGDKMISTPIEGRLSFNHLSFSYPKAEAQVLSDINFTLEKGETLGILGKTGAGKTSLMNLILKLYNLERGMLFIDDVDINDYSLDNLRKSIGYVPQDNFLFSASIRDNISFFKDEYEEEDIMEATKVSSIYDSIIGFNEGFDTILGERGVNLSGGQKQRISIARAVIKKSPILILDDALSAVDTVTEATILKNLRNIRRNKTTIIIAHRISALKDSDRILVLDNGRVVEYGTHEELMSQGKGGVYYETYKSQYKDSNNKAH